MFLENAPVKELSHYNQDPHEGCGQQCIIQANPVLQVPTRIESYYEVCIFQDWTKWKRSS